MAYSCTGRGHERQPSREQVPQIGHPQATYSAPSAPYRTQVHHECGPLTQLNLTGNAACSPLAERT
eukprot:3947064-Prymnesium_polylepis.1